MIGALKFMYSSDATGKVDGFGATAPSAADLQDWQQALEGGYPDYAKNTYQGAAQ